MLKGSLVALITPFKKNDVDAEAFTNLIRWHLMAGTNGFIVCGSTGESTALTNDERDLLIQIAVHEAQGKVPVVVGCGTPSTTQTIEYTKRAKELGADAALIITPYYVKPSQEGVFQHIKAIHDAVELPIILYNNPARVIVDITVDTIVRMCELPRFIGLKDSHLDASRISTLRSLVGNRLALLSGEDSVLGAHLLNGADGTISVVANAIPDVCAAQMKAWFEKDCISFMKITQTIHELNVALGMGSNPSSIKYALSRLGHCTGELRLPLLPVLPHVKDAIDKALKPFLQGNT